MRSHIFKQFQFTIQKLFLVTFFAVNSLALAGVSYAEGVGRNQAQNPEEGHYVYLREDLVLTDLKPEQSPKEFNGIEVLGYIQKPEYNMTLLRLRSPLKNVESSVPYAGGLNLSELQTRGYRIEKSGNFLFVTSPEGQKWLLGLKNWSATNPKVEPFSRDAVNWLDKEIKNRPGHFMQEVPAVVGGGQTTQTVLIAPQVPQRSPSKEETEHYVFIRGDRVLTDLSPEKARREFEGVKVIGYAHNPEYNMTLLKLARVVPGVRPTELYLGGMNYRGLQVRGYKIIHHGNFIFAINPQNIPLLFGLKDWKATVPGLDEFENEAHTWIKNNL